jgi:hypothetical protein
MNREAICAAGRADRQSALVDVIARLLLLLTSTIELFGVK